MTLLSVSTVPVPTVTMPVQHTVYISQCTVVVWLQSCTVSEHWLCSTLCIFHNVYTVVVWLHAVVYLNTDYVCSTLCIFHNVMYSNSLVAVMYLNTDYAAHYVIYFTMYSSSLVAVMYLNTDYTAHYVIYFTMYSSKPGCSHVSEHSWLNTAHYVYFTMLLYSSSLVAVMYLNTHDLTQHTMFISQCSSSLVAVMYLNTDYAVVWLQSCIWTLTTYAAHYVYFTMYSSSLVAVIV